MRVPLRWLSEWVDVPWDADELAERLTAVGLAVEQIEYPGREVSGVRLARIRDVRPHPGDERLRVCAVDHGGDIVEVVTAAANAVADAWVIYAPPGARLAGGTEIRTRTFGDVRSEGMLCSAWELGLPSGGGTPGEHLREGVLLLSDVDVTRLAPGEDASALLGLGEPVLLLDLTPNYAAHCQSILGVAREVAALSGRPVHPPAVPAVDAGAGNAAAAIDVAIEAPEGCGRYIARLIDDVRVGPSPLWLRRRLQLAGMRPINNVVDVTNYVMLETGQPLHGFDRARLSGGRIVVRWARPGETLRTLDGERRRLESEDLVIADADRPVALAGIMGGADSEVRPSTRHVLLEAAYFAPASVLRASRRLGLRTEASVRFEKGLDPEAADAASERAVRWIVALAGGRLAGKIEAAGERPSSRVVPWQPERINALLGTELGADEIAERLGRYGFSVSERGVTVPGYRTDVHGEADLAEEVARLYGYDNIPDRLPDGAPSPAGRPPRDRELLTVRRHAVACGFTEIATFSFAPADLAERLRLPADHPQHRAVRLANPMSEEQATLRATLLGGILDAVRHNVRHGCEQIALFEIGTVYLPAGEGLPREHQHWVLAAAGAARERHWQGCTEPADVFLLKGALTRLSDRLGRECAVVPERFPFLHPGRSAAVRAGGRRLGYLGELHPDLADDLALPERLVVAEVDLSSWLEMPRRPVRFERLPRFPAVDRDIAFVLPLEIPAARAEALIRERAGEWLEDATLFDVYQGEQVPAGHRSLAYALRYRAADRTLTDEEVDEVNERVRQALVRELGVTLR